MTITQRSLSIALSDTVNMEAYVAVPEAGSGPGVLFLHDEHGLGDYAKHRANLLAEEGWVTLVPDLHARMPGKGVFPYDPPGQRAARKFAAQVDDVAAIDDALLAFGALLTLAECSGQAGVVGTGRGGLIAVELALRSSACACTVAYDVPGVDALVDDAGKLACPTQLHLGACDSAHGEACIERLRIAAAAGDELSVYVYDEAEAGFDNPNVGTFLRSAHLLAKSRMLALLRERLGPRYDLAALWDHHLYTEFAERDVDDSMETMVDEPYVLVVPTVTGGTGKHDLHRWYSRHFHFQNPEDTRLIPISRTVGADRLVDEFVFCFTHDRVMDWILPGVEPTGKPIEIPMVAVVNFRGQRLYHEHIWWDQASVLVQAGLLDPDGLPVTGTDQAAAIQDETQPRNRLIPGW